MRVIGRSLRVPLAWVLLLTSTCLMPPALAEETPPADESEETPDFEPVPDRWRIQPPPYELNEESRWWNPYRQNALKGDLPIYGNDIFMRATAVSRTVVEGRSLPLPSGASASDPGRFDFFGTNDSVLLDQKFVGKISVFKGATAYRPFEWEIVVSGVADINQLSVWENGIVDPDVRDGTDRTTTDLALQEAAFEVHLADVSSRYDFVSTKIGRQPFNSDFRSLIFSDTNQGARLLGSADGNRYQYNLIYFLQAEKDTNSELNTFALRDQHVFVVNLYVQDFLFLGYQTQVSVHYNYDDGKESGFEFDNQGFLVRPDPIGVAQPHNVEVVYLGWTGEGHIGPINVSHAVYEAVGSDTQNPIAGRSIDINGQLAFLELSIDRDWMRYQGSVFFSSADGDPRDGEGRGFDTILDAPKIMGGEFSYWNRQSIPISDRGGVRLMQANSIIPDLRSSKLQGQSNFVNPGLLMFNLGATAEVTPKLRAVGNVNYIRFVDTESLELVLKQPNVREDVGVDLSLGVEYRPLLSNNVIVKLFGAVFQPVGGFRDIYQSTTLYQAGTEIVLLF
jgi:hypothetical protein